MLYSSGPSILRGRRSYNTTAQEESGLEVGETKEPLPITQEKVHADHSDGVGGKLSSQQLDGSKDSTSDGGRCCPSLKEGETYGKTQQTHLDEPAEEITCPRHDAVLYIPGPRESDLGIITHYPRSLVF